MFHILILSCVLSLLPTFGFAKDSEVTQSSNVNILCEGEIGFLAISSSENRIWIDDRKYKSGAPGYEARDVQLVEAGSVLKVRGELEITIFGQTGIVIVIGEITIGTPTTFVLVEFDEDGFRNARPTSMTCRAL